MPDVALERVACTEPGDLAHLIPNLAQAILLCAMRTSRRPAMREENVETVSSRQTGFVRLNTKQCKACWKCIPACHQGVIGRVDILVHKHAKFRHPERCRGCLVCTKTCENGAISTRQTEV